MSSTAYNVWRPKNITIIIGVTILANALLFMGLPALTRMADRAGDTRVESEYILTTHDPPKPPEDKKEEKLRRKELKRIPTPKMTSITPAKMDAPKFAFDTDSDGVSGLAVAMVPTEGMDIGVDDLTFSPTDVDTPPRAIRTPPVNPPYEAVSKGLSGRVLVHIRVGVDGKATNIQAIKAEPPDVLEVYKEAAEKAVARYRYEPARLGGEAVSCWANQPIVFEVE